jgi:hypothetical protein
MPTVLHVWCACGRVGKIPYSPELEQFEQREPGQLRRRLRCSACGRRAVDIRRGWDLPDARREDLI